MANGITINTRAAAKFYTVRIAPSGSINHTDIAAIKALTPDFVPADIPQLSTKNIYFNALVNAVFTAGDNDIFITSADENQVEGLTVSVWPNVPHTQGALDAPEIVERLVSEAAYLNGRQKIRIT